jgi:hypothetical protein
MTARRHTGGSLCGGVVASSGGGSSSAGGSSSVVCAARLVCSRAARGLDVLSAVGRACVCSDEALERRIRRALSGRVRLRKPQNSCCGGR